MTPHCSVCRIPFPKMELGVEDRRDMIVRGQKVSLDLLSSGASKLRKMSDTDFATRLKKGSGSFLLTVGQKKEAVLVVNKVEDSTKVVLHDYVEHVAKDDGARLRKAGTALG